MALGLVLNNSLNGMDERVHASCVSSRGALGKKNVVTLLVNAWRSLSNALRIGFTRGIFLILLGFTHHAQGRASECFGINQQSQHMFYTSGHLSRLDFSMDKNA